MGKYIVKIKLRGYLESENSDLYEFKMALFDNGNSEEFLLFIWDYNMTPEASGTLKSGIKIQFLPYAGMLIHVVCWGKKCYPRKHDVVYFRFRCVLFPINVTVKKKCAIRHGMRKPRGLKVSCCYDPLIDLN